MINVSQDADNQLGLGAQEERLCEGYYSQMPCRAGEGTEDVAHNLSRTALLGSIAKLQKA